MQMSMMPNYYRATVRSSHDMTDFKTIQLGNAQAVIGRCPDGSLQIQSILFSKDLYSIASATISAYQLEKTLKK